MADLNALNGLTRKEQRGSRARCILLTEGDGDHVADRLTSLLQGRGRVDAKDNWFPRGVKEPAEAKLGETVGLLAAGQRLAVTDWWLSATRGANTPNWDIASTCTVEGRAGLLLVEAKAHDRELLAERKPEGGNQANHERIGEAIAGASDALNRLVSGWNLSRDSHYQLSNRFAWSWKVASLGTPVILVYLGFLEAEEMRDQGEPFPTNDAWVACMTSHSRGVVPADIWGRTMEVEGTNLVPLLASMMVPLP